MEQKDRRSSTHTRDGVKHGTAMYKTTSVYKWIRMDVYVYSNERSNPLLDLIIMAFMHIVCATVASLYIFGLSATL